MDLIKDIAKADWDKTPKSVKGLVKRLSQYPREGGIVSLKRLVQVSAGGTHLVSVPAVSCR